MGVIIDALKTVQCFESSNKVSDMLLLDYISWDSLHVTLVNILCLHTISAHLKLLTVI